MAMHGVFIACLRQLHRVLWRKRQPRHARHVMLHATMHAWHAIDCRSVHCAMHGMVHVRLIGRVALCATWAAWRGWYAHGYVLLASIRLRHRHTEVLQHAGRHGNGHAWQGDAVLLVAALATWAGQRYL